MSSAAAADRAPNSLRASDFMYSWRATAGAPEEDEATINLEIDFVELPG